MKERLVTRIFSVVLIILGIDSIATGNGGYVFHIFMRNSQPLVPDAISHARFSGVFGIAQGIVFIGAGIFLMLRSFSGPEDDAK